MNKARCSAKVLFTNFLSGAKKQTTIRDATGHSIHAGKWSPLCCANLGLTIALEIVVLGNTGARE